MTKYLLLLAPLILALGLPVQADKKLMDLNYPDNFWGAEYPSIEKPKSITSVSTKTFCKDTYRDSKSRKNCIAYLSPFAEDIEKVKTKFYLSFCLPKDSDNKTILDPNADAIKNVETCLVGNTNLKRPISSNLENYTSSYRDQFTYKGKTYTASRVCEEGTRMRWSKTNRLFARALIEEIGCMTKREEERYWRNYKMQQNNRPIIINNPPPTYTQPQRTTVIQNNYDFGY